MTITNRTDEEIIDGPTRFNTLPSRNVGLLPAGATPSVMNLEVLYCTDDSTLITDFRNGQVGQVIKIRGNGTRTVQNGPKIVTNTGGNKVLAVDKVYTFTRYSDKWVEDA